MGIILKYVFVFIPTYFSAQLYCVSTHYKLYIINFNNILENTVSILNLSTNPISNQTINEIKKSQILLLIIITFFVFGFLFLIYHLKKVRIINSKLENFSKENAFLVSETNHRINNSLQIISLILSETIKKNRKQNRECIDLMRLQSNIQSIALLNRELYVSADKKAVDLHIYFAKIEESFSQICADEDICLIVKIDTMMCEADLAMYFGLLVSELIINSIKYAFEVDQIKTINIEMFTVESQLEFNYSDNGQKNKSKDIQPILVMQLCQQIGVIPKIFLKNGFHLRFIKSRENA